MVGLFRADYYPYDAGVALIHIGDAQKLFRMGDDISGVRLRLDDPLLARDVAMGLSNAMPNNLVSDWSMENPTYFRAVEIEKKRMMFF